MCEEMEQKKNKKVFFLKQDDFSEALEMGTLMGPCKNYNVLSMLPQSYITSSEKAQVGQVGRRWSFTLAFIEVVLKCLLCP